MPSPNRGGRLAARLRDKLTAALLNEADQAPSALVAVYDENANSFRFGVATPALQQSLGDTTLRRIWTQGLVLAPKGILAHALSSLQAHTALGAYAVKRGSPQVLLLPDSSERLPPAAWEHAPETLISPSDQFSSFARLTPDAQDYLCIMPYSATGTLDGLVLAAWFESGDDVHHLDAVATFLIDHAELLSAFQFYVQFEEERGRASGYRRLARLVQHEDNGYLFKLKELVAQLLRNNDALNQAGFPITPDELDAYSARIYSKIQLNRELQSAEPLLKVDESILYEVGTQLKEDIPRILARWEFAPQWREGVSTSLEFADDIDSTTGVAISPFVIDRILSNLFKNSAIISQRRRRSQVRLSLLVSIESQSDRRYLVLRCRDDAGGLDDPDMPRSVTPEAWARYCESKHAYWVGERGNGFWQIARYAGSANGWFRIEESSLDVDGDPGLSCEVALSLASAEETANES